MGWRQRRRVAHKQVLVIGGGMAGLSAAARLAGKVRVTLADPSPWFEWLPNIHELVSGLKTPEGLRLDREALLDAMNVTWRPLAVSSLDGHAGEVHFDDGCVARFDGILLAIGGVHDSHGVPGSDAHALPFKTVEHCRRIGEQLRDRMAAGGCRLVVVGAGVEGIEALGEVLRLYRHHPGLDVVLVDSAEHMLAVAPPQVDAWLREHLTDLPVTLRMGERVASVAADHVQLANGEVLPADMVVWTGGVAPPPLLAASGLAGPGEWLPVEPDLQARRGRRVWVAGDVADWPGAGKQAYHAMDMGALAAANMLAWFHGRARRRFVAAPKPLLVTFGDLDSFLISGDRVVAGVALGQLKELIYQLNMAALERGRGLAAVPGLLRRLRAGVEELSRGGVLSRDYLRRLPVLRIKI